MGDVLDDWGERGQRLFADTVCVWRDVRDEKSASLGFSAVEVKCSWRTQPRYLHEDGAIRELEDSLGTLDAKWCARCAASERRGVLDDQAPP